MNTKPVDKNQLWNAIVDAIDSEFNSRASREEFTVRALFGLEGTGNIPDTTVRQRMIEVIMDAAIDFIALPEPPKNLVDEEELPIIDCDGNEVITNDNYGPEDTGVEEPPQHVDKHATNYDDEPL